MKKEVKEASSPEEFLTEFIKAGELADENLEGVAGGFDEEVNIDSKDPKCVDCNLPLRLITSNTYCHLYLCSKCPNVFMHFIKDGKWMKDTSSAKSK